MGKDQFVDWVETFEQVESAKALDAATVHLPQGLGVKGVGLMFDRHGAPCVGFHLGDDTHGDWQLVYGPDYDNSQLTAAPPMKVVSPLDYPFNTYHVPAPVTAIAVSRLKDEGVNALAGAAATIRDTLILKIEHDWVTPRPGADQDVNELSGITQSVWGHNHDTNPDND